MVRQPPLDDAQSGVMDRDVADTAEPGGEADPTEAALWQARAQRWASLKDRTFGASSATAMGAAPASARVVAALRFRGLPFPARLKLMNSGSNAGRSAPGDEPPGRIQSRARRT